MPSVPSAGVEVVDRLSTSRRSSPDGAPVKLDKAWWASARQRA